MVKVKIQIQTLSGNWILKFKLSDYHKEWRVVWSLEKEKLIEIKAAKHSKTCSRFLRKEFGLVASLREVLLDIHALSKLKAMQ